MRFQRRFLLASCIAFTLYLASSLALFATNTFTKKWTRETPPRFAWTYWNRIPNRIENFTLCEQPRLNDFIREPLNTFSSLFFTSTYVFPLLFAIQDSYSKYQKTNLGLHPKFSYIYGFVCLFHTSGTSFNHICACILGLLLDNTFLWSMLGWHIFMAMYLHLPKTRPWHRWITLAFMFYVVLCGIGAGYTTTILSQTIITVTLIVIIIITSIVGIYKDKKTKGKVGYFWVSLGLTVVGIFFAGMDEVLCYSVSFGTHALWHIIGSFAVLFLYVYQWSIVNLDDKSSKKSASEDLKKTSDLSESFSK